MRDLRVGRRGRHILSSEYSYIWWFLRTDVKFVPDRRVGPVSSLHDRACELFFTIKGGTGD